jgi:putative tributyrin esterase
MPDVNRGDLNSESMRRSMPYMVALPPDHDKGDLEYPVLYLLHGLFGAFDNWFTLTGLAEYATAFQMIIVTPEGGDGWYTDSATAADENYESYLIRELVPAIDAQYRTINDRSGRAVAGLSMGGYGALKFGVKYPVMFAFTASVSGAFDAPDRLEEMSGTDRDTLKPSVLQAFGGVGSDVREKNDLYKLISALTVEDASRLPAMYFDCGLDDGFLDANRRLATLLAVRGISYEYQELPGGHDWDYWDNRVQHILKLASEILTGPERRS